VTVVRGLLLAFAVLACAWYALGARQAIDISRATAIVTGPAPITPTAAASARSLLDNAGVLNPDTTVDVLRGRLLLRQGEPRRALPILERVTRLEPDNLQAWIFTAQAALRVDRPELALAGVNIARLYKSFR
jgi:hypothetical protein